MNIVIVYWITHSLPYTIHPVRAPKSRKRTSYKLGWKYPHRACCNCVHF